MQIDKRAQQTDPGRGEIPVGASRPEAMVKAMRTIVWWAICWL